MHPLLGWLVLKGSMSIVRQSSAELEAETGAGAKTVHPKLTKIAPLDWPVDHGELMVEHTYQSAAMSGGLDTGDVITRIPRIQEIEPHAYSNGEPLSLRVNRGALPELPPENLDEVLPYDGVRGTVHRSHIAKTGLLVGRTVEDGGRPRPIGFESSLERAVAISCLLHPDTIGLKCQERKVEFDEPVYGVKSNTLDFLLTQRSGARIYLFVKNDEALDRPKIEAIARAIRSALPEGYGFAILSEASFPPVVRGNNERMFLAKRSPDPGADTRLAEVLDDLLNSERFTINEIVFRCQPGDRNADRGRIFDAVLRAIADKKLVAPRHEMLDYLTVLGWPK